MTPHQQVRSHCAKIRRPDLLDDNLFHAWKEYEQLKSRRLVGGVGESIGMLPA
jgi:hypothetical protein